MMLLFFFFEAAQICLQEYHKEIIVVDRNRSIFRCERDTVIQVQVHQKGEILYFFIIYLFGTYLHVLFAFGIVI